MSKKCNIDMSRTQLSFRQPKPHETLRGEKYLVIDPCYVFDDNSGQLWLRICESLKSSDSRFIKDPIVMSIDIDGVGVTHDVFIFSTAYGDGCYPVLQNDRCVGECGVDAGLLCFIPYELVIAIDAQSDLGVMVELPPGKHVIDYNTNFGNVSIGGILVDTLTCYIDDDDDDDDDRYEEDDSWHR